MYPEFEKVNKFLGEAETLLNGLQTMEEIFYSIFNRNKGCMYAEYFNEKEHIHKYSYRKMYKNVLHYAGILQALLNGKEKHQPIIIKVPNNPHWGEIFWAVLAIGYKPFLIDARTSKEGTQNLIEQSHAVALITEDPYRYTSLIKIDAYDLYDDKDYYEYKLDWENEVIFSSSGTTGNVKLMVMNGQNICHQICCSLDLSKDNKDIMYPKTLGKCKILAMIPFHHIFGFVAVFLWYTYYGKTLVFPTSNAPRDLQKACQKMGVTHAYSVPLFWDALALQINRKAALADQKTKAILENMIKYNTGLINKQEAGISSKNIAKNKVQKGILGNKIRFAISGGGFLSEETLHTINGIGYPLYNGYGMTEIGVTSVELAKDVKVRLKGSIGKPFHGVSYKVDTNGELLIKSPTIHVREIINGELQETKLDENGYFHSGDIAEVDNEEHYYLKGRIKDIIINSDGENIFPDELEIYFKDLPHIVHLTVLGIANKKNKQETVSLVLELDNSVTEEDLKQIEDKVHTTKLPHNVKIGEIYLSKGKLPIANNMKIKRFVIKKAIEANSEEYFPINTKQQKKEKVNFDQDTIVAYLEPIKEIFSKILILPKFKIENDAHWINDLGGDSMSYVELIKDIEDEFKISFPENILGDMATINDFVKEVKKLKETK